MFDSECLIPFRVFSEHSEWQVRGIKFPIIYGVIDPSIEASTLLLIYLICKFISSILSSNYAMDPETTKACLMNQQLKTNKQLILTTKQRLHIT